MALETEWKGSGAFEKTGVGAAVGDVAGLAAVDACGCVLKDKGSAFVGVALQAGLFIDGLVHHARPSRSPPGGRTGTVRIVAVAARHKAFIDAMFEGHGKLRADVGVTAIAEVHLLFGKERLGGGGLVYGVAVGTDDIGTCVV